MSWAGPSFRRAYVAEGGGGSSARSYSSYLNRADRVLGGLEEGLRHEDAAALVDRADRLPPQAYGGVREKRDSLAALRSYVRLRDGFRSAKPLEIADDRASPAPDTLDPGTAASMLVDIKALAARYYRLTGKPLGVTGEIAELLAAQLLGLTLAAARTPGHDAILMREGRPLRIQIKGRAVDRDRPYRGRCPAIRCGDRFDLAMLVLIDRATMEPIEIWEASEAAVADRLGRPGSKARNERASLAIMQFRSVAMRIWPVEAPR